MRYQPEAKYIASIFPSALERIAQYHGPSQDVRSSRCTIYRMPQVLRGQEPDIPNKEATEAQNLASVKAIKIGARNWCAVMEVTDAFENVPDTQQEAMGRGRILQLSRPIRCEDIANNLLTQWSRSITGLPAGAGPGMMIIANTSPSQAELEQMHNMQAAFYEFRLSEGDRLFMENNVKRISQQMKDAAVYLNRERTWSGSYGSVGTVDCPHCFSAIHPRATACPHCQRDIKSAEQMAAEQKQEAPKPTIPVPPAGKGVPAGAAA